MGSIVSQDWWNALYDKMPLVYNPNVIEFKDLFERYLRPGGTCFEVGCYPGTYLVYLGQRFGYTVSGIDATPYVLTRLPGFLAANGVPIGALYQGDFLEFEPSEQYDVVLSIGFIEHFTDFRKVIEKHVDLLKPGGTLIMSCPNLRGLQRLLYLLLDRESLRRHVLAAMNLKVWEKVLTKRGMRVVFQGYYRTVDFFGQAKGALATRIANRIVAKSREINAMINYPNFLLSPIMISISRKGEG